MTQQMRKPTIHDTPVAVPTEVARLNAITADVSYASDGRPLLKVTSDGQDLLDYNRLRHARMNVARFAHSKEDLKELLEMLGIDGDYEQYWEKRGLPVIGNSGRLPDFHADRGMRGTFPGRVRE